jgi:hypothetical protein
MEVVTVDLDQGNTAQRILSHNLCLIALIVTRADLGSVVVFHDVTVGHRITVRRYEEARAHRESSCRIRWLALIGVIGRWRVFVASVPLGPAEFEGLPGLSVAHRSFLGCDGKNGRPNLFGNVGKTARSRLTGFGDRMYPF